MYLYAYNVITAVTKLMLVKITVASVNVKRVINLVKCSNPSCLWPLLEHRDNMITVSHFINSKVPLALPAYFCSTWCLQHYSKMVDVEAFLFDDEEIPSGMVRETGNSGVQ